MNTPTRHVQTVILGLLFAFACSSDRSYEPLETTPEGDAGDVRSSRTSTGATTASIDSPPSGITSSSVTSRPRMDGGTHDSGEESNTSARSDATTDAVTTELSTDASVTDRDSSLPRDDSGSASGPITTGPVLTSVAVVLGSSSLTTLEDRATFEVLCTYDEDEPVTCTDKASVDVSHPGVASLNIESNEFQPVTNGTTAIVASVDGLASEPATLTVELGPICTTLRVTGATSAAAGNSLLWEASCDFDDGRTNVDVSDEVLWTSDAESVAQVSDGGTIDANEVGSASIRASITNPDESTTSVARSFTVTNGVLVGVTVSAVGETSVPEGMTTSFSAECEYSDITTDCTAGVTWVSSSPTVATISAAGVATGHTTGTSNLSASLGAVVSNELVVTVTPAVLVNILLNPSVGVTLQVNSRRQLTATCVMSNATTSDCTGEATWSSSSPLVATVDERGVLFGHIDGPSLVGAAVEGVTSTAVTVTIVPPNGCDGAIEFPDEVMLMNVRDLTGKAAGAIYYDDVKAIEQFEHQQGLGYLELLDGIECFTSLKSLTVERAWLENLDPIVGLIHLETLKVGFTRVGSIPDISHLTALSYVDLAQTEITDLYSLVVAEHFGDGDYVNITGTDVSCTSEWALEQIEQLEARDVEVEHICM
jgi:hypothetical protein